MNGYLLVAMGKQYVQQAYLCAKSIRETQSINNVSLMTSDEVPECYKSVFDHIIEVPWHDKNAKSFYATEHRWKVYHVTPYEHTVVLDTDMIFTTDVSHWWKYLKRHSVLFTTNVNDYRGNAISDNYYRKAFTANNLPNLYCAFHYFKKDDLALEYYKNLELVCTNWEEFYKIYSPKLKPNTSSMDINHAIAVLHTGIDTYSLDCMNFVHMKSHVQKWITPENNWIDKINIYGDISSPMLGNFKQSGILHYTEQKFCEEMLDV